MNSLQIQESSGGREARISSVTRFVAWARSVWRRVTSAERGAADDLPVRHEGPAPSDLLRNLPPGGGRLGP
jgi:hypothetical protein